MHTSCLTRGHGWPALILALLEPGCGEAVCGFGGEQIRPAMVVETRDDMKALEGICVEVLGDLEIRGEELTDLSGLEAVYGIHGDLIVDAPALESTAGLEHLEFVRGSVVVKNAAALPMVELPSLHAVGLDLVYVASALTTLDGTPSLSEVGRMVVLQELYRLVTAELPPFSGIGQRLLIQGNPRLEHIIEPNTLHEVRGAIEISGNPELRSVVGFDDLDHVAGQIAIHENTSGLGGSVTSDCWDAGPRAGTAAEMLIRFNSNLESVAGFSRIERFGKPASTLCLVTRGLSVQHNPRLSDLEILSSLGELAQLEIVDNDSLVALDLFPSSEPYGLTVVGNDALQRVTGVPDGPVSNVRLHGNAKLRTVEGIDMVEPFPQLEVSYNDQLSTLDGISIGGDPEWLILSVTANARLTDVTSLLRYEGRAAAMYVVGNAALPQAQAEWLALVLTSGIAPILLKIAGNDGWQPPEVCPFVGDGMCDEDPVAGIVVCRPGTDVEDCATD